MAQEFKKGKNEIVVGFTVQAYNFLIPLHNFWPKGIVALDLR